LSRLFSLLFPRNANRTAVAVIKVSEAPPSVSNVHRSLPCPRPLYLRFRVCDSLAAAIGTCSRRSRLFRDRFVLVSACRGWSGDGRGNCIGLISSALKPSALSAYRLRAADLRVGAGFNACANLNASLVRDSVTLAATGRISHARRVADYHPRGRKVVPR